MEGIIFIYLITNKLNGKYYVGKTCKLSLKKYFQDVISGALRGDTNRPLLHRAIRKYGAEAFDVSVLTECDTNAQAADFERLWIVALDSRNVSIGYNVSMGGEGTLGVKLDSDAKQRMSESRKGRTPWNKGIPLTADRIKRLSNINTGTGNGFYGKKHSDQTKAAVAAANSRRVWDDAARLNMRLVQLVRYKRKTLETIC